MKKIILFLLINALLFPLCTTVQGKKKKVRKEEKTVVLQLTEEQQRKYDYFFLEAIRMKEKKEYATAFGLLQHCLEINPNASSALYEISQYYMFLRQVPQGQAALEKAVAYAPDNYWYSQGLVSLYQQQNELDKAVTLLETMVTRFPVKQDPLFNLLDIYSRQEKYNDVISTLNRLEKRLGKNEQLSMEKFRIYLQMKDDKKAFREIESLVQEYPMDMRYQVILGDVYLQNGKKQEAYEAYQKVLAVEPDNPMALFSMASYYDQTGQKELYQQQLDTLLLNKKVAPDTKINVMRQIIVENEQSAAKDSTQVIALFDRIMKLDQDDPQIPMLYAQYLLSKNMEPEAVPVLEQGVDLDPTNKAARLMLVSAAVKKEDYKQIIKVCEPGIEATPDALELYYYLAIAYHQAEQTDSVLSICSRALEHITPDTRKEVISDFYSIMGDIYQLTNANLSVSGLSSSWKHEMKSGGWSLSQLSVLPKEKKTFNLKVEVPLKVNKGNYHFVVYAGNAKLPLDVVVAQKGTYQTEFTTDQPNMQGNSKSTFTFSATLKNQTAPWLMRDY